MALYLGRLEWFEGLKPAPESRLRRARLHHLYSFRLMGSVHLNLPLLRLRHTMQKNVREAGRDHAPLRGALSRAAQETVFDDSRIQPFIDHPSDNAVRDSLVEKRSQVGVWN
jgi:hypothetical protein